jgi:hypothetical protein
VSRSFARAVVDLLGALATVTTLATLGAAGCAKTGAGPDAPASAWSLGPAMPRRALAPGVTALGVDLVVAGGFDTSASAGQGITARVDAFDTSVGTWSALPDAPVRWTDPDLAGLGGTLYLVGGLEGTQRVARGESFLLDPLDHQWHPLPAMPAGDERGGAGVTTAPGKIYLLGGVSSTAALASCLEFDVATRSWSHLPDLPAPRARPAAMRRSDGTLIVAGGFAGADASDPRGEVWTLPPAGSAQRAWTPATAMHLPGDPGSRGGCAYGVVLGQLICAGGAASQAASSVVESSAVESYDPYDDAWTGREPMPVARTGTQGAAVGGRLYVPGGSATLAPEPTDTLYIYAPLDTAMR